MSSGGEKRNRNRLHLHRRKKPLPEKFQRKQTRVKVKNPQHISREMQIPLLDTMSRGRKIQRSIRKQMLLDRMSKSPREQKPERSLKAILCSRTALFTEEAAEEQGRKIASDDYRHRDTYHSSQKKGRYHQRREIKSRERVKQFDFEQDFRQRTLPLPKRQNRNFMEAKS